MKCLHESNTERVQSERVSQLISILSIWTPDVRQIGMGTNANPILVSGMLHELLERC